MSELERDTHPHGTAHHSDDPIDGNSGDAEGIPVNLPLERSCTDPCSRVPPHVSQILPLFLIVCLILDPLQIFFSN